MTTVPLEARVAALEAEVTRLRAHLEGTPPPPDKGWKAIVGTFADDSLYEEAMRLGREYREAQRPKPRAKKRKA